ncbi:MAG: cytochrome c-type biogenesis protein CcmH [Gammaproteobacteria bacterium]|jgi:cytochrome c-type biogenesis protein CcmH|nr:cytochrome c-type biogenesis protein CcmH [Gammaproteobacteria bacterium]
MSSSVRLLLAWSLLLLLLQLAPSQALAIDVIEFQNTAEEQRFRELTAELRCLVCQNQSLDDSSAPLAQDLRNEVLELMRAGRSNEEIREYLVARYGDFVLYRPRFTVATLLLWLGPALLLLGGLILVFRSLRRMQTSTTNQPSKTDPNP